MSQDRRKDWLATLKPGDEVIIKRHGYHRHDTRKATVQRITPTGRIIVENSFGREARYNPNGQERGVEWSRGSSLQPATEAAKRVIELRYARSRVKASIHHSILDFPDELVLELDRLIQEGLGK